jgi:tRNA pseudouridine55 synthase
MDGVLVVDKPQRLTSHDVVAAARRALRETRIGHIGTLDPLATGVLPMAIGRATRLVRFLTASDKDYDATIRFGVTTDTYDITGAETSRSDAVPARDAVAAAIASLTGDYLQVPPAYSAKKVDGRRAYEHARKAEPVTLAPVPVRVTRAELVRFGDGQARVHLTCSAGFYVRSFAHSLGELVGTGACLEALRRTRSGDFTLDQAIGLDALFRLPLDAARGIPSVSRGMKAEATSNAAEATSDGSGFRLPPEGFVPLDRLLPRFPTVRVSDRGREFVSRGRELSAGDYETLGGSETQDPPYVRIVDPAGALLAVATPGSTADSLHPSVVLV